MDLTIMIGGAAGQGVAVLGHTLAKALARGGYHIFANQEYESRIKGGHNFFQLRVREEPTYVQEEKLHLLIALTKESIELHRSEMHPDGLMLHDSKRVKLEDEKVNHLGMPLEQLALDEGGGLININSVAAGAAVALLKYDFDILAGVLEQRFKDKAESNIKAARAGFEYIKKNFPPEFKHEIHPRKGQKTLLINANEAISLGALAAGCKFIAAYPMSPSTSIFEFLAGKSESHNIAALMAEDEISAMNMAVGAGFTGVRAMTCTSGGGFSLMVEALGLAGMTETPVVAVLGQRGGPSTGLPTRMEQGELEFVLHASQGEFPRVILAPRGPEDAFTLTVKAFNIAERYQLPVIILTDVYLVDNYRTIKPYTQDMVKIDRGALLSEKEIKALGEYKRYSFTESGISPRALPGQKGAIVATTGDEHTEDGHITEEVELRNRQMQKRMAKLDLMRPDIEAPLFYGAEDAPVLLIGWGSSYGVLRESVDLLEEKKIKARLMHLNWLWPFPSDAVSSALKKCKKSFVVENNFTGQLARLIRTETGLAVHRKILKYDGRPFYTSQIVKEVSREVE